MTRVLVVGAAGASQFQGVPLGQRSTPSPGEIPSQSQFIDAPYEVVATELAGGSGTRAFAALPTVPGDFIVVSLAEENDDPTTANSNMTASCSGSLAVPLKTDTGTENPGAHTRIMFWTIADATGGSRTVTITPADSLQRYHARACVVRNASAVGNASNLRTAQSMSFARSADNSLLYMAVGDWAAGSVGSPVWVPGGTTIAAELQAGVATYIFGRWDDSGTTGTATTGISSPSYTTPSVAVLEMLAIPPASPDINVPDSPNGIRIGSSPATVTIAHTYYVSAAGSDAADGLTTSTPWATISKVNGTTLVPGDSVSFRGGDTFSGQIAPTTSGTAAAPIVYKSYGTGNATISNTSADAFAFVSHGGFEVRNLTITGGTTAFSNGSGGVDAYSPAGSGKFTHIVVDGCDISGFQHSIIIGGDTTAEGFSDVTINNCDCHGNKNDGVALWGGAGGTAFSNSNVTITNVRAYSNLGDSVDTNPTGSGIVVGSTDTCLIDQCVAHDNGGSNNAAGGPVGIWCYDSTAVTIQRCLSYSNKTAGSTDGGGFDLDINVSNSTIQYCMAYNNDGPGYMFFASGTSVFTGNTLRYNVGWGNVRNTALTPTTYGEMLIGGTVASSAVYGNTFYAKDNASNNISALVINATPTGLTVRNNIFQSQAAVTVLAGSAWATSAAFMQGNDYYRASGTQIKWGATTYTSLATWRAAVTGQEQVSAVNVGFTIDPVFSSPTTSPTATTVAAMTSYTGLRLQSTSTLLGAGLDLNGTFGISPGPQDFWGDTLSVPLSVGADETGVASDVTVADTPSGLRLGSSPLAGVTTDVGVSDTPSGIRLGASPSSTTIDQFVADAPSGLRVGATVGSVAFGVVTADTPSGLRLGSSALLGVTIDLGATDTPSGLRLGTSPSTTTIDQLITDAPSGLRIGSSPATAAIDVSAPDTPTGIRLGQSYTVVTLDSGAGDTPSGIRIGSSPALVSFDVAVGSQTAGVRLADSPATVAVDRLVSDAPTGLRLGVSPATVGIDAGSGDVPASGFRLGASPASVAYDQLVSDTPSGIRLSESPAVVGSVTNASDTPIGLRLGASPIAGVTIGVAVADVASGLRVGASPVGLTFAVAFADIPSGIRLGASPAGIGAPVFVADIPSGLRLGESPALALTSLPEFPPDTTVFIAGQEIAVDVSPQRASVDVLPANVRVVV
jgi:hypothetical protein